MANSARVTLKDVANAAFVSVSTVSQALNGSGRISAATRTHVRKTADQLGYRPSKAARSLQRGQKSDMVAAVVHGFEPGSTDRDTTTYWRLLADTLTDDLSKESIGISWLPPQRIGLLAHDNFDAIVIGNPPTAADATPPEVPANYAIIVASNNASYESLDRVDGFISAQMPVAINALLDHLLEEGATQPALLIDDMQMTPGDIYIATFEQWCQDHECKPLIFWAATAANVKDAIGQGADALFMKGSDFSRCAEIAIRTVEQLGMSVPDDVLVASSSEDLYEPGSLPTITTLSWQGRDCGHLISDMLIKGLHTGNFPPVLLPYHLEVRHSTTRKRKDHSA